MPAYRKTAGAIQAQLGPEFRLLDGTPSRIVCLACDEDGRRPFVPKHLGQHASSGRHQRNKSTWVSLLRV
ncbi:unnamed protein product [Tilletia laevis]|nr:unnamed protein product [Tilletia laevis]